MFSKRSTQRDKSYHPTLIAEGCTVTGDITSLGDVQIDGHLKGDLKCVSLIIGEQGSIEGVVTATTATFYGFLKGRVAAQTIRIARTARILGDLRQEFLSIEEGAQVEGRMERVASSSDIIAPDHSAQVPLLPSHATSSS